MGKFLGLGLIGGGFVAMFSGSILVGCIVVIVGLFLTWGSEKPKVVQQPYTPRVIEEDRIPCPYCAELIKPAAIKCRFCLSDLDEPYDDDDPEWD